MAKVTHKPPAHIPLTGERTALIDADMLPVVQGYTWGIAPGKWTYAQRGASAGGNARTILMHREIYEHAHGPIAPGLEIDHINGDVLDNRLKNLRAVTHRANQLNMRVHRAGQLAGVQRHRKKWTAKFYYQGKQCFLGSFSTELEAHQAYLEAVRQHCPQDYAAMIGGAPHD